ncbi:MAG: helix-turn-helix transcriptional regulator [Bacillota bacterium]
MKENLPQIMTVMDVAAYLRISRSSAYGLLYRPDFPAIRIDRTVRIAREVFLHWLQQQENSQARANY